MSGRMYCRSRYQYSNQQGKDGSRKDSEVFYQIPAIEGIKRDSVRLSEAMGDYSKDTAFHSISHTNVADSSDTADNEAVSGLFFMRAENWGKAKGGNLKSPEHYLSA